jgi:hypothetical protein
VGVFFNFFQFNLTFSLLGGGDDRGRKGNGKGWAGDKESGKRLRTLRTKFLLRHQLSGCYLFSHKASNGGPDDVGN